MSRQLVALVAVAVAAATACGPTHPASAPSKTSTLQSGASNGQLYTVTTASTDGATPDGRGHWHTHFGRLAGGDPAVSTAFNRASNASATGLSDQAGSDAGPSSNWTLDVTPTVTFRPTAVSELFVGVYYCAQAAHPVDYVSTIVIDSRDARPITLKALFSNESRGLQRLSEQTKLIMPEVSSHGSEPREENFANWIPTAAGLEIHFADDQFGHGLPVITVPWTALADVLAPDMSALTRR